MKVLEIKDQPDGSCIMECEFTEKEVDFFLNYAVNDILKKQIEKMSKDNKRECFDCGEEIANETFKEYPDTEICIAYGLKICFLHTFTAGNRFPEIHVSFTFLLFACVSMINPLTFDQGVYSVIPFFKGFQSILPPLDYIIKFIHL